jgi:hypothetical protein
MEFLESTFSAFESKRRQKNYLIAFIFFSNLYFTFYLITFFFLLKILHWIQANDEEREYDDFWYKV